MRAGRIIHAVGVAGAVLALGLAGCQRNAGSGGGNTQAMVQTSPQPITSTTASKVKAGPAPLTYLMAAGGNVRVVDATAGTELARSKVAPQTFIRVDAAAGVYANDQQLAEGPLPKDHQYEIWLDR